MLATPALAVIAGGAVLLITTKKATARAVVRAATALALAAALLGTVGAGMAMWGMRQGMRTVMAPAPAGS